MVIDGLGNMLGILPVKKEKEAGRAPKDQKKNKDREQKKDKEEDKETEKEKEGRIDVRI